MTTFIFKDYIRSIVYDSDASDDESHQIGKDSGEQNAKFGEVLDLHCSIGQGDWPWPLGKQLLDLFKPALLLNLLLKAQGNTLKQLGLTTNDCGEMRLFPYHIQRRFKIAHFLDFKTLTHLDHDMRVLRSRRGSYYS